MNEVPGRVVILPGAALARSCAEYLAECITSAIAERGRCAIALAGGSSPRPVYAELSAQPSWLDRLVITGEITMAEAAESSRRNVILQALGPENGPEIPARLAWRGTWFLDPAAASRLSGST